MALSLEEFRKGCNTGGEMAMLSRESLIKEAKNKKKPWRAGSNLGNNLDKVKAISKKEMEVESADKEFTEIKSGGDDNIVHDDCPKCCFA